MRNLTRQGTPAEATGLTPGAGGQPDTPSIDAILALAAALAATPARTLARLPINPPTAQRPVSELVGFRTAPTTDSATARLALQSPQPNISNDGEPASALSPATGSAPEALHGGGPHLSRMDLPDAAQTEVPLDFRPISRSVPVTTKPRPATDASKAHATPVDMGQREAVENGVAAGIERKRRSWRGHTRPTFIDAERTAAEAPGGRLLDARGRWSTPRTESPPSRYLPLFNDGGLSIPELRVVARNDTPTPVKMRDLAPPTLRLIDLQPDAPAAQSSGDLAARLAGAWRHSFLQDAEAAAELEGMPAGDEPCALLSDVAHGVSALPPAHASVAGSGHETLPAAAQPASVPLFDEILSVEPQPAAPEDREPLVTVRQAAMEIANEARHLQHTGGSAVSFTLRLHPEHLGQVAVEIQRGANVWSVALVAANDEARDALETEISRLMRHPTFDRINVVTQAPD